MRWLPKIIPEKCSFKSFDRDRKNERAIFVKECSLSNKKRLITTSSTYPLAGNLKNKIVYQLVIAGSQVLLPVVSYPYVTRILGPSNLGKINYVDFLSQIFLIFASFGIPFYGVREIAKARDNASERAILVKELTILNLVFAVMASVIFIAINLRQFQDNEVLFGQATVNIFISAFSFEWYLQGMEAFRFSAIRTAIIRILMLAAIFLLVHSASDYLYYSGIFMAGFVAMALLNSSKMLSENRWPAGKVNLRRHLDPLFHFFLTSSAISIYIYFDTVLLQKITGNEQTVGWYTTSLKLARICQVAILSIGTVMIPRMSFLVVNNDKATIAKYQQKILDFIIAAGIPAGFFMMIFAEEIIGVIAGQAFTPSVNVLRIIAFLPLMIALSNLFSFQTLIPFHQEKKFLLAVAAGAITSIALNVALIPSLGEQGAAWANIITETFITLLTGLFAARFLFCRMPVIMIVQTILASALFYPLLLLSKFTTANNLLVLSAGAALSALSYYLLQHFIFRNHILSDLKAYLFQIFKTGNREE